MLKLLFAIYSIFKTTDNIDIQYRSNVSYHLSSRFSRDESRFSREKSRFLRDESRFSREDSRFSRESLRRSVWNILLVRSQFRRKRGRYQSDKTDRRDEKKKRHFTAIVGELENYFDISGFIWHDWMIQTLSKFTERVFYRSSYDAPLTFIQFLTRKSFLSARAHKTHWERSLKFHGKPASFENYSISLVLFGTIGWFKRWNKSNLQKKWFIEVLTLRR